MATLVATISEVLIGLLFPWGDIGPFDPPFEWRPCSEPLNVSSIGYQKNLALFEELKLPVSLEQFDNRTILETYENCNDLVTDFEQVLAGVVNTKIWQEMNYCYEESFFYFSAPTSTNGIFEGGSVLQFDESELDSIEEDSFDSNNQDKDVDEADIVKSDGVYVYTVYGSEIITLDLIGNEVSRLDLFPGRKTGTETENTDAETYPFLWEDQNLFAFLRTMFLDMARNFSSTLTSLFPILQPWVPSIFIPSDFFHFGFYYSSPIKGLFLHDDTLIAIISESFSFREIDIIMMNIDDGKLSISQSKTFNGRYKTARRVDSNVHLILTSWMPSWRTINWKIARNNANLTEFNDTEYAKAAFEIAISAIPTYAESLVTNLLSQQEDAVETSTINDISNFTLSAGTCDHIVKITYEGEREFDESEHSMMSTKHLDGFLQIISFDIPSGLNDANLAGIFVPDDYPDVYANKDMLFIGGRSHASFSATNTSYEIATQVVAFEFQNASVVPKATGIFPGYTINQFAFDYYENHLRIATTSWATMSENSTNRIIVASIQNETIQTVGSLEGLGESERIFAVRFLGDLAFMVTFRIIDPFYTIDLSIPERPVMRGELKIPGFSNYLHPVEDNYILAVGQDADEVTGFQRGLQVTLFDISDLDNPVQIAKYVVDGWSSSNSQNDHLSFRYLPESRKLILPVSTTSFDGFHIYDISPEFNEDQGEVGISLDFVISHYDEEDLHLLCFSDAQLEPRSLVFQGDVMTFKGHNILSHDLNTGEELFDIELDTDLDTDETCLSWF